MLGYHLVYKKMHLGAARVRWWWSVLVVLFVLAAEVVRCVVLIIMAMGGRHATRSMGVCHVGDRVLVLVQGSNSGSHHGDVPIDR